MTLAVVLLVLGLLLIFLEFYFPGAIIGTGGAIMILASIIIFAQQAASSAAVFAYILFVAVMIGLLIRYTLRRIRKTAKEGTIYLESDEAGFTASHFDRTLIGREGVVTADLKPAGHIAVAGHHYQASSEGSYLVKGAPIVVIGGRGAYLIVKPLKKDATHD